MKIKIMKKQKIAIFSLLLSGIFSCGISFAENLSIVNAEKNMSVTYTVEDLNGYNSPTDFNWMSKNWLVKEVLGEKTSDPSGGYGAPCYMRNFIEEDKYYLTYGVSTNEVLSTASYTFKDKSNNKKIGEEVDSIIIRMYAHLSDESSVGYYTAKGGVRIYSSDSNGTNDDGYMIPSDIPQNQWYYLALSGDDLKNLADTEGYFSGFAIGSNCVGAAGVSDLDGKMYAGGGWTSSKDESWIAFDTISVGSYLVTFRDGNNVMQQLVAAGDSIRQPSYQPVKENYVFSGWQTETGKEYSSSEPVTESVTLIPKWKHKNGNKNGILSSAAAGDYLMNKSTLEMIGGFTDIGEGAFIPDGPMSVMTYTSDEINHAKNKAINEALATSRNGSAFAYKTHSWGIQRAQNAVKFTASANVSDIDAIILRVYVHLSSGETYNTSFGGVILYPLGADGSEGGYTIPADIEQDKWVDLILPGKAVEVLSHGGMIDGFQIGSGFRSSDDAMAYQGTANEEKGAWVLIDSIAAVKRYNVTYFDSDNKTILNSEQVYQGYSVKNLFIPEKNGKIFTGWKLGEDFYNFDSVVNGNIELVAGWDDAAEADISSCVGYYEKNGQFIALCDGNTEFSEGLIPAESTITSVQISKNDVLYVLTRSKVFSFRLGKGEYEKQEHRVVTFALGTGKSVKQVVKAGESARPLSGEIQRSGYIFNGWKTSTDTSFVIGETIVNADITVSADWNYNCIAPIDYERYYGTYYDTENQKTIVLKAGNRAIYENSEYIYYILVSDELVIELNGKNDTFNATMYATKIATQIENYYKLKTYRVAFDTDGGNDVAAVTIGEEQGWKLSEPVAPEKNGYVFQGWYLADGTRYDFNTVISGGFTLFAKWQPKENVNSGESNKKGCASTVNADLFVGCGLALSAVMTLLISQRKKRR